MTRNPHGSVWISCLSFRSVRSPDGKLEMQTTLSLLIRVVPCSTPSLVVCDSPLGATTDEHSSTQDWVCASIHQGEFHQVGSGPGLWRLAVQPLYLPWPVCGLYWLWCGVACHPTDSWSWRVNFLVGEWGDVMNLTPNGRLLTTKESVQSTLNSGGWKTKIVCNNSICPN